MRVLLIAPCFGSYGGIEAFLLALGRALHQSGVGVRLCLKKVKGFELDPSLESHLTNLPFEVTFLDRGSLRILGHLSWADLVHCHNPLIEVVSLSKLLGKPVVVTVYNWCRRQLSLRPLLWRLANRMADRSWYISDFVWSTWEPRGPRKTSGKPSILCDLPQGVVPPNERKGFVFVSRWIPNKGLRTLIEAYSRSQVSRRDWPLTLMGNGPLRAEVEQRLRNRPVSGIEVTGFVTDEEKQSRIRHARWMVTPANTREDLGLTPIEARHVGVPCIVTRDGGLPEAGGNQALVCAPGDVEELKAALERAAEMDEEEYAHRSEATRLELLKEIQPLSVYIEFYEELLESD